MNEKDFEDYKNFARSWTTETIIGAVFSMGMEYMVRHREMPEDDVRRFKQIMVDELDRRIYN